MLSIRESPSGRVGIPLPHLMIYKMKAYTTNSRTGTHSQLLTRGMGNYLPASMSSRKNPYSLYGFFPIGGINKSVYILKGGILKP
jgi:hypothetical protein